LYGKRGNDLPQGNPIYVGEIRHNGTSYSDQHEPIICRQPWDRVQEILAKDAHARMGVNPDSGQDGCPSAQLLHDMGVNSHITFTSKKSGKRYRSCIPKADKSATGLMPADQIDVVVVNLVLQARQSLESVQAAWIRVRAQYRRSPNR
jgi:hypothetical protein